MSSSNSQEGDTGWRASLRALARRAFARAAVDSDVSGRQRSLVGRLLTALVATAVVLYVAAIVGIWWTGGRVIDDSVRKQAVQWLAELDEIGTPVYVARQREPAMRALAQRLKNFPDILYVRYYDATGARVLGEHVNGKHELAALTADDMAAARQATGAKQPHHLTMSRGVHVRVTAPIQMRALPADALLDLERVRGRQSTKVIGYIDFSFDAGDQRRRFQQSLLGGSLVLAIVLGVAVVLGRRRIQQAMAPLIALEEPLARLARGDMDVDMGGGGDREIVAIRDALNSTISALKQRDDALRRAECDTLTGLVNQRYFNRQLALERNRVERDGEASAVLHIELDRFEDIKNVLGIGAADRMLGQVAGLLRARVRENDVLARLAGAEFIALVRSVNRDGALKVARSINQVVREFQFVADEESFRVTVSIGIAMLDGSAQTPEAVLEQALAAARDATGRGGDRHALHDGDVGDTARETDGPAWSRHVQSAIQDDALKFVYQPILGLRAESGEMYETLLRLKGPGGQLVSPGAFLPLADRFGLTLELDRWVIRRACEELARLHARGREAVFFVNLSGHVFEDGEALMHTVAEQLTRSRLSGRYLVFEITEQVAIRHLNQTRLVIEGLGTLGCRFALDDFGSGFSSLSYLKHLPAAFLKISGTFVENVVADPLDDVLIRSIVQIAGALNMQTVAESVENRQTLQRIMELGVDFAQGHYVARPAEERPEGDFFSLDRARRLAAPPPTAVSTHPESRASSARKR